MGKTLVTSKTFWLAAAQALLGAFVIFSTTYPQLGWLMLGKSVVDVIIRYFTTQPISTVV